MLLEVEKQVDMFSGNASGNASANANTSGKGDRDVDMLSPLSRRESIDHDDYPDGHDGLRTQTMLKAILAKLQEDKNAGNNLGSPSLGTGGGSTTKGEYRVPPIAFTYIIHHPI